MQKFDIIEIQKNAEEKRLIFGKKFEDFLLRKMAILFSFFDRALSAKNSAFFGSFFIILLSIWIRSAKDIGHDSATYIEIAQKMLAGGHYFEDFFELNFPLSFWITLIPVSLAKLFSLNAIILTEIFVNLVGIFSLYFCYKILTRSYLAHNRKVFNLLILSFAVAFFLRVFTLQFNEFATKSTYFLALVIPYFCFQILENSALKKSDQITIGILAALIFALKPNYGFVVIVFELAKLLKTKKISQAFCLRNYCTLAILLIYAAIILFLHFDYIKNFQIISSSYYEVASSRIFTIIKEDIFPLFLFIFLTKFLASKHHFLRSFYLLILAVSLLVISELIGGYDQRFVLYSLSFPLIVLSFYYLIKDNYFDFRRHGILLFFALVIPLSDPKNIFALALDICAFWFVFTLFFAAKKMQIVTISARDFYNIFLPKTIFHWLGFALLAVGLIALSFNLETAFLAWASCAILFILQLNFFQEIHSLKFNSKKFSALSATAVTLVLSYFIALHFAAIFNLKFQQDAFNYKSPNYINSEIIKTVKANSSKEEQVIIISQIIPGAYPVFNYIEKINPLPSLQMPLFYHKISAKELKDQHGFDHLFSKLKVQMENEKNKLIFIEIKNSDFGLCNISFIEYYLRDAEFRKIFFSNYRFLNRITDVEIFDKEVEFFDNGINLKFPPNHKIKRDVEVYVRK